MEAARYAGFAAGPLLGALLLAGAGLQAALLVDAVSFAVIAGVAVALRGAHGAPAGP
jgi:hypothetical protein